MAITPRAVLACVLVGVVCLPAGYFAGREHLKYEMRNAVESALENFRRGLNVNQSVPSAASPVVPPAADQPPPVVPKKLPPVLITLDRKGFKDKNIQAGDFEEDITLGLSIKNLTSNNIRAFDGIVTFTDLLDNKIMSINLAINDQIEAGHTLAWAGGIKYNRFIDADQRLRGAETANMKLVFTPRKALFADGTMTLYDGQ